MTTQKRYLFLIVSFIQVVLLVTLIFNNGCGGRFETDSESVGGAITLASTSPAINPNNIVVIPNAKTASVVSASQVVDHLSMCVGVKSPSDTTLRMYDEKRGAISLYGTADTITSPMMVAIVSLAGEVCNDLIHQEKVGPARIFQLIDMQANGLPSDGVMGDSIARLALSCWGRRETMIERQTLLDMVGTSIGASEAQGNYKAALMLCSSMLSSLDALLN